MVAPIHRGASLLAIALGSALVNRVVHALICDGGAPLPISYRARVACFVCKEGVYNHDAKHCGEEAKGVGGGDKSLLHGQDILTPSVVHVDTRLHLCVRIQDFRTLPGNRLVAQNVSIVLVRLGRSLDGLAPGRNEVMHLRGAGAGGAWLHTIGTTGIYKTNYEYYYERAPLHRDDEQSRTPCGRLTRWSA